jgi:hypothetical protein
MVITICNYEKYQSTEDENETTDGTTDGTTDAQQTHTIKEFNKKDKNIGRSSKKKDTDPRVKEFLTYWGETFLQETGSPYSFSWEKEGKLAKDLLKVHSLETLQDVAKRFFKDDEAKRKGFDIGTFKFILNRIVSKKAMDPLEEAKREIRKDASNCT